jgi:hypothetical protein
MSQYVNSYFNIKIDFPDTWGFRYWGNRKNAPEFPGRYQMADDDLPTELAPEKELLIARSRTRRHSLEGTTLFIGSLYRLNGFSLQEHRAIFESDLKREFHVVTVDGIDIQTLYLESQGDGYIWYTKLYCWQHCENIWLFCGIKSDALDGFEEVKAIAKQFISV